MQTGQPRISDKFPITTVLADHLATGGGVAWHVRENPVLDALDTDSTAFDADPTAFLVSLVRLKVRRMRTMTAAKRHLTSHEQLYASMRRLNMLNCFKSWRNKRSGMLPNIPNRGNTPRMSCTSGCSVFGCLITLQLQTRLRSRNPRAPRTHGVNGRSNVVASGPFQVIAGGQMKVHASW